MKQVEVAEAVGISRAALTNIERGADRPGRETLMALAAYYDVSLDWLASGQGEMRAGQAAARSEDEALLLYAYRRMPEDEAKMHLQLMLKRAEVKGS